MATPELVSVRDFTTSRYGQIADNLDAPLNDILARAEAAVQSQLNRRLLPQPYVETFRPRTQTLFVHNRPITSLTQIRRRVSFYSAWETLDLTRVVIEADPGYIQVVQPVSGFEVEVSYTAGYVTLPEDLREAIIMQAVLFSFQDLEVYGTGDAKAPGIMYMYDDLDRILKRYKQSANVWH